MREPIRSSKPTKPENGAYWEIHTDGATRQSNPSSEGGWGFAVFVNGLLYYAEAGQICGNVTSNGAELAAIYHASEWAHKRWLKTYHIKSDSTMATTLCGGRGTPRLPSIERQVFLCRTFQQFADITYTAVPRTDTRQQLVDFLANLGIYDHIRYTTLDDHFTLLDAFDSWH